MSEQREFEKKLNVGIVGVGGHAYRNILPTMTCLPVSLVAVCDTDFARAKVTAAQYGAKACYESTREITPMRTLTPFSFVRHHNFSLR